jgi:tetraacyldisaccharide 4'-kinase
MYGFGVICRNAAFDLGLLRARRVSVPVISVGNLTAGGTGKTPLVEMLVGLLLSEGRKPVVVSRGYGRQSHGVLVVSNGQDPPVDVTQGGDEPVEIAHRFPSVGVVVGGKRVDAALLAISELHADVIVLDDGYQHRYLKRDLDIVVLDARTDLTRDLLLPAGRRREPLSGLSRAGLLVIARTANANPLEWEGAIRRYTRAPLVRCRYAIQSVHRFGTNEEIPIEDLRSVQLVAFSGIGRPQGFMDDLRVLGLNISGHRIYPDHHWYREKDLHSLVQYVEEQHAGAFITTEKDAVRLEGMPVTKEILTTCPVYFTRLGVELLEGEEVIRSAMRDCLQRDLAA